MYIILKQVNHFSTFTKLVTNYYYIDGGLKIIYGRRNLKMTLATTVNFWIFPY